MLLSFVSWAASLSNWVSLVLSSNRVRAETSGFLHLFCVEELKGPNRFVSKHSVEVWQVDW